MLNQAKVLKALHERTKPFFAMYQQERLEAQSLFEQVAKDSSLALKIVVFSSQFTQTGLPYWSDSLDQKWSIDSQRNVYSVVAVDGSQIYPDRHQGVDCYLINIGTVLFTYGQKSSVQFTSEPKVFFHEETMNNFEATPELINCQRTEYELRTVLEMGLAKGISKLQKQNSFLADSRVNSLCMFDGALIFWHLGAKESIAQNKFFKRYCEILQQLYEHKIMHAGYISMPKSRELIHVLQAAVMLPEYKVIGEGFSGRCLIDTDIIDSFLRPGQRTVVFKNHAPIVDLYAEFLRPCFFYMHTGAEIARVEIPAWIAQDAQLVEQVASMILDQAVKGNGYPICLAEAHEQAVIKTADRELFYMMLQKIMQDKNIAYKFSQKSMHKRVLGI